MERKTHFTLRLAIAVGLLGTAGLWAQSQTPTLSSSQSDGSAADGSAAAGWQTQNVSPANAASTSADGQSNSTSQSSSSSQSKDTSNTGTASVDAKDQDSHTPEAAKHKVRVRLGTITVAGSYTYFSPGFFPPFCCYGFYPYGALYSPFYYPFGLYGPYLDPYGYTPNYGYASDKGKIELSSNVKSAQVFIDGAYAGNADKLKNFWLAPGAYNVSVSAAGRQTYQQRVYVLTGKSVKLKATLEPEQAVHPQGEEKP